MKNKIFIIGVVVVLGIISIVYLNDNDDVSINESQRRGIEEIVVSDENVSIDFMVNMEIDEYISNDFVIKDAKINDSYFEGVFVSTIREELELLRLEVIIYNKNKREIGKVNFELDNVVEGQERDLFCLLDFDYRDGYSFEAKLVKE